MISHADKIIAASIVQPDHAGTAIPQGGFIRDANYEGASG